MARSRLPALLVSLCLAISSGAAAQDAETIALELNKAETVAGSCRITLVVKNDLASALEAFGLDLVIFDKSNGVAGYAGIDIGPLPKGKTRVRQYDLPNIACDSIASLLVNDVRACERTDAAPAGCQPYLKLNSLSTIDFIL